MKEIFEPIRDNYIFAQPCEDLALHIEFFSESIVNDSAFTVEMFPSWTPTIYINLGQPYHISLNKMVHSVGADTDILVLRDCDTIRYNPPCDRIFTIKFRPGGLEAILGISQLALKGKILLLDQIFPTKVIEHIKKSSSFYFRKKVAENYFLANKQTTRGDHYAILVKDITDHYLKNGMKHNVSQLAELYFITSKSISRYFHRVIGISPKDYFSILRARTALTAYAGQNLQFDPCNFGYYDTSHFYKEAARFTGFQLSTIAKPRCQY